MGKVVGRRKRLVRWVQDDVGGTFFLMCKKYSELT